jgi:hypothetical protein
MELLSQKTGIAGISASVQIPFGPGGRVINSSP